MTKDDQAKSVLKANQTRKEHGMTLLTEAKRSCLKCGKKFKSESGNNRICVQCKCVFKAWYIDDYIN